MNPALERFSREARTHPHPTAGKLLEDFDGRAARQRRDDRRARIRARGLAPEVDARQLVGARKHDGPIIGRFRRALEAGRPQRRRVRSPAARVELDRQKRKLHDVVDAQRLAHPERLGESHLRRRSVASMYYLDRIY